MKATCAVIFLLLISAGLGCGDDEPKARSNVSDSAQSAAQARGRGKPKVVLPGGPPPVELVEEDLIEGSGPVAKAGDWATVQYVGVGLGTRKEFDSSWDRNEPFTFQLGARQVIWGWDEGIVDMKVGGRRQLLVPSGMAYGEAGFLPAVKPDEALVFVIDLLKLE